MTDRSSMDRPATAVAASLGAILILVSAALFYFTGGGPGAGGSGGSTYAVAWEETQLGQEEGTFAAEGVEESIELAVQDDAVSNLTVELDCAQTAGTPARGNALVTWELTDANGTVIGDGQAVQCQDTTLGTFEVGHGHPDRAEVQAGSLAAAREDAWDGALNTTTVYTLTFRYERPTTQTDPLPQVMAATFDGRMRLVAEQWDPRITEQGDEEVPR